MSKWAKNPRCGPRLVGLTVTDHTKGLFTHSPTYALGVYEATAPTAVWRLRLRRRLRRMTRTWADPVGTEEPDGK